MNCFVSIKLNWEVLTVEGQVAKYSREEIHDEHPEDGNISNGLHSSLGWTYGKNMREVFN